MACGYLSVAPHCATAKRGASPCYSVPLLESCAHHAHPLLMVYAHIHAKKKKKKSLSFAINPRTYRKQVLSNLCRASPKMRTEAPERAAEVAFMLHRFEARAGLRCAVSRATGR